MVMFYFLLWLPLIFGVDDMAAAVIIAGVLAAVGQGASSYYTNKQNDRRTQEARDWEEAMMDKQNEYNLPDNQKAREQAAGWYRNAAGQGSEYSFGSAGVNSVNPQPYQDPMGAVSQSLLNMFTGFNQEESGRHSNSLREVERQNIAEQAQMYKQQATLLGLQSRQQMIVNEYANALNEVAVMNAYEDLNLKKQQIYQLKVGTDKMSFELQNVLPEEIKKIISETQLNMLEQDKVVAEIENIYHKNANLAADTALKGEQLETEQSKQENLSAGTANLEAGTSLTQTEEGQIKLETQDLQNTIDLFLDTYDDQLQIIANKAKLSKKEVRWYIVNSILHGVGSTAGAAGGAALGAAALKRAGAAAGSAAGYTMFVP